MQAWGLIVLLVSKAAGHAPTVPDMEQDKSAGVLHSQRGLAEITEMIRISFLIHQVCTEWEEYLIFVVLRLIKYYMMTRIRNSFSDGII